MGITKLHGLAILVTAGITGAIWYHQPFSPGRGREHTASPAEDPALKTDVHETPLMLPWRQDVLVLTPWLAPIVWEGTFSRDILNAQYLQKNLVTGVVTFAVEKDVQFIEGFMRSANQYFLAGHPVNFYLFTDSPWKISHLQMAPENQLFVIPVQNEPGWQDTPRSRLDILSSYIQRQFQFEVDYLFSVAIDVQLLAHIGVEIIDALVATISSWQATPQLENQAFETHPGPPGASPGGQGDFHYTACFYGGSVSEVYKLARACSQGLMEDRENGIGDLEYEESHPSRENGIGDLEYEESHPNRENGIGDLEYEESHPNRENGIGDLEYEESHPNRENGIGDRWHESHPNRENGIGDEGHRENGIGDLEYEESHPNRENGIGDLGHEENGIGDEGHRESHPNRENGIGDEGHRESHPNRENGIRARWHEESHLNRYLLQHRPTRLLSPEYYWDSELSSSIIWVKRMCPVHRSSS